MYSQRRLFTEDESLEKKGTIDDYSSKRAGWHKVKYNGERENSDSIYLDIFTPLFTLNSSKTIYMFHTPPYDTNADIVRSGYDKSVLVHLHCRGHVGSVAVRKFIEKYQPYLTL